MQLDKYFNKTLFFLFLLLMIGGACQQEKREKFLIEGEITGFNHSEIYIAVPDEFPFGLKIDTIHCSPDGLFSYECYSDTLIPVVLYFDEGTIWTTVWGKNGDTTILKGDVRYPELLSGKGGSVNDKISVFKQMNRELLMEIREILDKEKELENQLDLILTDSIQTDSIQQTDSTSIDSTSIDSIQTEVIDPVELIHRRVNINNQLHANADAFLKENPESVASLILLQDYLFNINNPIANQEYLDLIQGDAREYPLFKILSESNTQMLLSAEGATCPEFFVTELTSGDTISLETFDNQYFLLCFSASWCEYCDIENEEMISIRKKFSKKDLGMLTFSLDENPSEWKALSKEKKLDWYQSVDSLGWLSELNTQFNINAIPTNILVDKEKIIIGRDLPLDSIISLLNKKLKEEKTKKPKS